MKIKDYSYTVGGVLLLASTHQIISYLIITKSREAEGIAFGFLFTDPLLGMGLSLFEGLIRNNDWSLYILLTSVIWGIIGGILGFLKDSFHINTIPIIIVCFCIVLGTIYLGALAFFGVLIYWGLSFIERFTGRK